jgi:adsorption protein A
VKSIAMALLLGPISALAGQGNLVSEVQRFRSYPFIDKAYQALRNDEPVEAEKLSRHVLDEISPHVIEARVIVVQALDQQGLYKEALDMAASLPPGDQAALVQSLRLNWINQGDLSAAIVEGWLAEGADAAQREQVLRSYAQRLHELHGPIAALRWLQGRPASELTVTALLERSVFAEQAEQWMAVISDLEPLAADGVLPAESWRRLGLAYVLTDNDRLPAYLQSAPSSEDEAGLRVSAAERAIGQGQAKQAKQLLLPLERAQALSMPQRALLLQAARDDGDVALATELAVRLDRPCLESIEWLSVAAPQLAREALGDCSPAIDPRHWLILAQRLEAEHTLMSAILPEPWNTQRQDYLLARWLARNEFAKARDWLQQQAPSPRRTARLAQIAQSIGDKNAAASEWREHYRATGEIRSADLASFLWLQADRPAEARAFLADVWQRRGELPEPLLSRLVDLYVQAPDLKVSQLDEFARQLPPSARGRLYGALAAQARCGVLAQLTVNAPTDVEELRALGVCSLPQQPGQAVVYLQLAAGAGDIQSRGQLAYALAAAGLPEDAYAQWSSMPADELDIEARLALSRVALTLGHLDAAEQHWQDARSRTLEGWRMGALISEARGRDDQALERYRQAQALGEQPADYYQGAVVAFRAGREELGMQWLRRETELAPENGLFLQEYGMRLAAAATPAERAQAVAPLSKAAMLLPENTDLAQALAFRLIETGELEEARAQLRRSIDLLSVEASEETQRFAARRQHESLERRNRISLATSWSPDGVRRSAGQRRNDEFSHGVLLDHPLDSPFANRLSAYGRIMGAGKDGDALDTIGGGVGLRYMPFQSINLNLYGELFREDKRVADNDLMLRASASFLDEGEYRNDWRVDQSHWPERSLYMDAAWWVDESERLLVTRFTRGHAFKLPTSSAQTLGPYLVGQGTEQDRQQDLRVGAGLRWQLWFDDDRYNAYRRRLSMSVEYQQALGGNLYERANGLQIGIELAL